MAHLLDLLNAYSPALLWYAAHFGSPGSALALTHHAISSVWNVWAKRVPRRLLRIGTISFLPLCRAENIIRNIFPAVNKILLFSAIIWAGTRRMAHKEGGGHMPCYPVLAEKIAECGLSQADVAKELGITAKTLYNKLYGKSDFKWTEICTIIEKFFPLYDPRDLFVRQ